MAAPISPSAPQPRPLFTPTSSQLLNSSSEQSQSNSQQARLTGEGLEGRPPCPVRSTIFQKAKDTVGVVLEAIKRGHQNGKVYFRAYRIIRKQAMKSAIQNHFGQECDVVPLFETTGRIAAKTYYIPKPVQSSDHITSKPTHQSDVNKVSSMIKASIYTLRGQRLVKKGQLIQENHLPGLSSVEDRIDVVPRAAVHVYSLEKSVFVSFRLELFLQSKLFEIVGGSKNIGIGGIIAIDDKELSKWQNVAVPLAWRSADLVVVFVEGLYSHRETAIDIINRYGKVHFTSTPLALGSETIFGTLKFEKHRTGIMFLPGHGTDGVLENVKCWDTFVLRYLSWYVSLHRRMDSGLIELPPLDSFEVSSS